MKLYNYYRLVRTDETGKIITGNDLKQLLTEEGFTLPALKPYPKMVWPPRPGEPGANEAGIINWSIYWEHTNDNGIILKSQIAEYWAQFDEFATCLEAQFELARLTKDKVQEYRTDVAILYDFVRAAKSILNNHRGDYINFIANDRLM